MAPTDYQSLIDAPTWAFIARTNACYPEDTASRSITDQRTIYDAMARSFHRGYPPGITARDESVGGVPCRIYPGRAPVVIYLHGGGFVVGGLDSHDDVCAEIAADCGVRVVSVDYRLAPEHRHPAQFDDAFAATGAVAAAFPAPLILAGDSAGGKLAAAAAHAARATGPAIAGQVLIYPDLGGDQNRGSYVTHAEAPMLTKADIDFYAHVRFPEGYDADGDVTARPLHDRDFSGLPPTVAIGAECDPLCDDAAVYAARIRAAIGAAIAWVEPGLVHGYLRARVTVSRARNSFARITSAISALAEGRLPNEPTL